MSRHTLRPLAAEFLGTFVLAFGVLFATVHEFPFTPFVAMLIVGLFVYTIGPISGAHINPSVTIGLWSIGKIKALRAVQYLVAQFAAAVLALCVAWVAFGHVPILLFSDPLVIGIAELAGAFMLSFGVCSVVFGNVKADAAGITIGGSLLLGIYLASGASAGFINPAVALASGNVSLMYLLGPPLGGILAAQCYKWLSK